MKAKEYKSIIEQFGLTQTGMALVLEVDPRTSRKWCNDERSIPATVAGFLRYMIETKNTPAFARLMKKAQAND
jgi:plasmid maintenance system antidote protein VapI